MTNWKEKQYSQLLHEGLSTIKVPFIAFVLALLCGAVTIIISGYSPIEAYQAIIIGSLTTTRGFVLSLAQATPIMFTGLAFGIAYRVRLINLGSEGQLYIGAMVSALIGAHVSFLPGFSHVLVAMTAGAVAGGLVGLLISWLKIKFGAHEVITSLMLNELIILFTSYLSIGPAKAPNSPISQTSMILDSARLLKIAPRSQLTVALIVVIAIAVMLQLLLSKTALGYEMKAVGNNLLAARVAGIHVNKVYHFTFFVSGAMAGLAGSTFVLGVFGRFIDHFSNGIGFAGISVAALAGYSPVGVLFSAFVIGILKAGALTLQRTTPVPIEFVSVVQAFIVVFVAAPKMVNSIVSSPKVIWGYVQKKVADRG